MNITPTSNWLILEPSVSTMRGSLFVPQQYQEASTSCLVIAKGPQANPSISVGDVVLCPVGFGERKNNIIEGTNHFICRDAKVYGIVRKGIIWPIGRTVLIRRDVKEKQEGSIVIPELRRVQSLDGTIVRLGVTRKHFKVNGLTPGDNIRLQEWREHMIEATLEDGSYGLIVHESDILYKYVD